MKRINLFLLRLGAVIITVLPVVIIFCLNWNEYVIQCDGQVWKLSAGGIGLLVLIGLGALGKLKIPNRLLFYSILLMLIWCIKPIIGDLLLLVGALTLGELLYQLTFRIWIKRYEEKILIDRGVKANKKVTQKIMDDVVNQLKGKV